MSSRTTRRLAATTALLVGGGLLSAITAAQASVAVPQVSPTLAPAAVSISPVSSLFRALPGFSIDHSRKTEVTPTRFAAYDVSLPGLRAVLAAAPAEAAVDSGALAPTDVTIPDPDGKLVQFSVQQAPVMQAGLAAAHPEIATYAGREVGAPNHTIALDITPLGFHASVRVLGGESWYVDPAYVGDDVTEHLSYFRDDLPDSHGDFDEHGVLDATTHDPAAGRASSPSPRHRAISAANLVTRRTYRLALISDPTYATFFGTANVLAAKATLMNRVNQIYTNDVAVRMLLVDDEDKLNLDTAAKASTAGGSCGADACYAAADLLMCGDTTLTSNDFAAGQIIGADKYDIGHVVLGTNGGGLSGLGVVGQDTKAEGCTGIPKPVGDAYAIDYVAHEMGHEFAGNHTFNGYNLSCGMGNRNAGTSVEPGSGSSVMAYAGICGSDDLQAHTDPYFSERTITEFTAYGAKATTNYAEVQDPWLRGFDTDGDSFTLSYQDPGGPLRTATLVRGTNYTVANIQTAMRTLTGAAVTITGYDGAATTAGPGDNGFTITWPTKTTNPPRIGVVGTTGGVAAVVGVQVEGGPSTNGGATDVSTNHAPVVNPPAAATIPYQTPFLLTGSANDADDDPLIYLWEQNDPGFRQPGTMMVDPDRTDGPLFRIFGVQAKVSDTDTYMYSSNGENLANGDASRSFPDMAQVLSDNTNAESGTCTPPAGVVDPTSRLPDSYLECLSEFLPTTVYQTRTGVLDFRLTARDQNLTAGGTGTGDVKLTVGTAGPFAVTSRATAGTAQVGGGTETVAWDVKGTDVAPYSPLVKISLSTDGGQTFPYVLAASTPNDGTQAVTLPMVSTTKARLKVEAVTNYFFDTNDANFVIDSPAATATPTDTSSPVATATVTTTVTPSATATVTETAPTATATVTQTAPTPSATSTTTVSPSATATVTETAPTATATVTQTAPTPTATSTTTVTPSTTATATETAPTATATATTTLTPPTATATATQTAPTPTTTTTTTVTPPTASATVTQTAATPTATSTTTVSPSATATVTQTAPTATTTVTTTLTPSATVTATATTTAPADRAPTARAVIAPMVVYVGQPVHLDASASTDPETAAGALSYSWDFGNYGTILDSAHAKATAHYQGRGLRTVTLTVTDPQGLNSVKHFPVIVLKRVPCEAPSVRTHGTFEVTKLKRAPGGAYCDNLAKPANPQQARAQDTMSYVFAGTMLRINYGTRKDGGTAKVYIDGALAGSLNFHSTNPVIRFPKQYALFGGLPQSNNHRLRIVVDSGAALLDSFSF